MSQTLVSEEMAMPSPSEEIARLRAEVKTLRETMAELQEIVDLLLIPETPTEYPQIVWREGICDGKPLMRGTRITVHAIIELTRMGFSPEKIVEHYQDVLTRAGVYEALAYFHSHPAQFEGDLPTGEQVNEDGKAESKESIDESE